MSPRFIRLPSSHNISGVFAGKGLLIKGMLHEMGKLAQIHTDVEAGDQMCGTIMDLGFPA